MEHHTLTNKNFITLSRVFSLFIAVTLYAVGQVMAAAPDLTTGGVPNDNDQWNLGPSGMAGWFYKGNFTKGSQTYESRQIMVKSVAVGSPAATAGMAVNDVILGVSGTGAEPVNFSSDARAAFGNAITDAEANAPAILKVLRWRAGVTTTISLTLETMGTYGAKAPYADNLLGPCPKSQKILRKGLDYLRTTNANDGNWQYSALTLLAGDDPGDPNNAANQAKAVADMKAGLILSQAKIDLYMSDKSLHKEKPWHVGPRLIALSEYYMKTSDPDPAVANSIKAYARCIANGQSMFGTSGHYFSDPSLRTPNLVNGPYNVGYGPINNANLPCYIGLCLAKKTGLVTDPKDIAGIDRARTFYMPFTHLGCAGYGEHPPYGGNDTNGKAGLQALAFQFDEDASPPPALAAALRDSTRYYAKASAAAAIGERDIGHTGSFFSYLYAPLGANVGGPETLSYHFSKVRYLYELARRWDGSFVYNSYSSGGVETDSLDGQGGCLMATPMLLTYAMPLRKTYMTGKDQDPANHVAAGEMPSVSEASADNFNFPAMARADVFASLGNWSPKCRLNAGRDLKRRYILNDPADPAATIVADLHTLLQNTGASVLARNGAAVTLGEMGDASSIPVLMDLLKNDATVNNNFVIKFGVANALSAFVWSSGGQTLHPHLNDLMDLIVANHKPLLPLDPVDPQQWVNGSLCNAVFYVWGGLGTMPNFVGVDRTRLYAAMRVCAANPQAGVRNLMAGNIYGKLTTEDIEELGDVFVNISYENAPAGMGVTGARLATMEFLQSRSRAEGVALAIRFCEDLGLGDPGIVKPLGILADYAGSSTTVTPDPEIEHFCEMLISGASTTHDYGITPAAQAVLDAIAADPSPDFLTPFKSISFVVPDQAAFNLPKKSTVLRVQSVNKSNPISYYTWRKLRGPSAVSFIPNGTSAAKDTTVVTDGTLGEYQFEVTMTDSHGLTELYKTVTVTQRDSSGNVPANSPPTANDQSIAAAQGTPVQVVLTGADPEGFALKYTVTTGPTKGTLSGTAPYLVYTAAGNATGADSIVFQVEDSNGLTDTATVSITVSASPVVGLAIYEPFAYAAGNLHGKSGGGEIGLTGTWSAGFQIYTEAPSLSYNTLPTGGGKVRMVGINDPGGSRSIATTALADRGLLANGATLWFSMLIEPYGGYDASGNAMSFALANNGFPYGPNIPDEGPDPGQGLGVRFWNGELYAAQFAATGAVQEGTFDRIAAGGVKRGIQHLVVGKITWGASSDTIEIYLPATNMALPAPSSVYTGNVDQSKFDKITFNRGSSLHLDEFRVGATLQSVLQGAVNMSPDVIAPTPAMMTFATPPAPVPTSNSSITMTAATAFDPLGVEYFFDCTAGGGNDSGWQDSNVYTDTGLTPGVLYSYTVKARDKQFAPAVPNENIASAAASATIPASGTVPYLVGLPSAIAQTQITNASLSVGTVTNSGTYSMTIPAGHVESQTPADGTSAAYGTTVNTVLSIGQDPALPVITSIVDSENGAQVEINTPITYTLTFNKDINAATLASTDFTEVDTATATVGTPTEASPGVVTVVVTPTAPGNLRFAVAQGAVIKDMLGNDLNTTAAVTDDTTILVTPVLPDTQIYTRADGLPVAGDTWNVPLNWNTNSGPVPSGTDNVFIPDGKTLRLDSVLTPSTPLYAGNLTLARGASMELNVSYFHVENFNALGTPGSTMIFVEDGTQVSTRGAFTPTIPAITLQGDFEFIMGNTSPNFNYPITGPFTFTISGTATATLNAANTFGEMVLSTQYGTGYKVRANAAGSLGGNVTVTASTATGGRGADLYFDAANAMSDLATLSLYGNSGALVFVNADDTIGALKINGVKQLPGTYNSGNSWWLSGSGTLTVTGGTLAYWDPSGGPAGTWNDDPSWDTQADLLGNNNSWAPDQIAAFNATGTYSVAISDTREIGGLIVSNGNLTLASGGLSLSSDSVFSVDTGASLTVDTVIAQNAGAALGLAKVGAGILTLLAENTFTGPVSIGGGTLSIATIDNAGAPSALGQSPNTGASALSLAGGTLRYTGGNASVNRGFTFGGTSTIEVANNSTSLILGDVETSGPGTLTATGAASTIVGLGNIRIVDGKNITLSPTGTTSMAVASVEGYAPYPQATTVTLTGNSVGNVVTGEIYASVYPRSSYQMGTAVIKSGIGEWKINGALSTAGVGYYSVTVNDGTLILAGNNTFTGHTNLNNSAKLVLDFAVNNTTKLANGGTLFLNGGTVELKGGSHIEVVGSTTLNAGPAVLITRNGGTAKLRMNALTRSVHSIISFLDGTVADTDKLNTNGILGGFATIGGDWAINSTNSADGPITALSSYDTWINNVGSDTANYLLNGPDTLTGPVLANTLKIANVGTGFYQKLDLASNNLSVTSTGPTTLGGLMYVGGGPTVYGSPVNKYTINGTGALRPSGNDSELILHTQAGTTLTVNVPIAINSVDPFAAGGLVKSGSGTLVLGGASVYNEHTRVTAGKLIINGSLSNLNGSLTVDIGATLGGSGTVGRNITIGNGGKLEFNLGTPTGTHVPFTRSGGSFTFSGASVLTITAKAAGAAPGLYTLITGGANISGSAPATVILPAGWAADAPVIVNDKLQINITSVTPPTNDVPVWSGSPLAAMSATEDVAFTGSITENAYDVNDNPLTFAKVSGAPWLIVAANGSLSGTPGNSDVGTFTVTVSVNDGIATVLNTFDITVANVNDAPTWAVNPYVAPYAAATFAYSHSLASQVTDIDANPSLTFTKGLGPAWLTVDSNGALSGTPGVGDVTSPSHATLTVSVSDGIAAPVQVTVQITVTPSNLTPVWNSNPVVGSNATEDSAYAGSLASSVSDGNPGDTLTFAKVSGPSWLSVAANGVLSGTPLNAHVGANTFTVSVTDGVIPVPVEATLNITVTPVNDAPVAVAQGVTAAEDTALPITLAGTDEENSALTYSIVTPPANGALSGTPPNVTYTPSANYNGPDSFTFKVNDGTVDSPAASVSITVNAVNDVPVALAQSVSTNEDTALPITLAGTDTENSPFSYTIVSQPANGTLSGTPPNVTYTPAANYTGASSFTFKVNDGTVDSAPATVSITVNAVNDVPVALAQSVSTNEDTALPITLAGTDTENSPLSYSIVSQPASGTLSGTPPNVTYTPAAGFDGVVSFTFKVNDGTVDSAPATVSITVNPLSFHWDGGIIDGGDPTANANGGTGNWDNLLTNWDTLAAASTDSRWSAGKIAVFSGTGATVTLTDNITVGGLTFNKVNGGTTYYTINGATNSKTLSFSSGDNYIRLNIGNGGAPNATITGQVAGTGANMIVAPQNIVASGGGTNFGTVTFNGTSTDGWTGSTTINAAGTLSTVSTATLANRVLASTSGITLNGGTLQFTRATNTNIDAISEGAISVNGGGTFNVTSGGGGASSTEDIGTVTVNSGQMNFVTNNNQNMTVLADLSRGSSTTSAATFSSSNFTTNAFSVSGAAATAANEIIGTWATTGTTAVLQTDYAVYDGSSRFVARGIAASAQSTWSTASAATSNYTMSALASATISGGTKNINSLRSTNNSVTVTSGNADIALASHTLAVNDVVTFSAGAMPTGLTAGTPYYVVATGVGTIQVSATLGGGAITPTGSPATVVASGGIQVSSGNNLGTLGILNGSATTLNILQSGGAGSVTLPSATSANLHITAGSGAISIAAPIKNNGAGALSLVKGGSGLLTLSSTGNDFTGGIVVNAGTLRLSGDQSFTGNVILNGGSLGDLTDGISASEIDSNSVTVNGNAAMVITGGETLASAIAINSQGILKLAAFNSGGGGTVSGVVSGSGTLTMSHPNNSGNGNLTLSNTANTHTGIVSIVSDNNASFTLAVNSLADSASIGAGNIQMGGGGTVGGHTFALHSGAIAPLIFNNRQVELVGDGGTGVTFKLANNSTQAFTINTNLLASGTNAKTLTIGGGNLGGLSTFAGTITNGSHTTLNLTKADSNNTWSLTNTANSYNGITTITAGTLRVSALANGGGNSSIGASTNVAANLILSGGTLEYTGAGSTTDRLFSLQSNSTINSSGTGAVDFNNTGAMGFNSGTSGKTLTLTGTNTGANTIAAVIGDNTGTTGITKSGGGTWVLSGNNSYTGATAINVGKLFINGNQTSANGAVSVAANATLGGTGTIGGTTTIATGGNLEFSLSTVPGNHDKLELAAGKTLSFGTTATLTINSAGGATTGDYTLISAPGGIGTLPTLTLNLPSGWLASVTRENSNTDLVLHVTYTGTTTYTVTYNGNSATSGTAPSNQTKNHDVSLTLATNSVTLARTGYVFSGWNTSANGLGTNYPVAGTYTANASVTLFAKWITAFEAWSGGVGFGTDSNGDGTSNGMAWLLGAANKDAHATSRLPVASSSGGNLQLNFTCRKVANRGSATLKLQVSDDLGVSDPWTSQEVIVPDTSGTVGGILFTISANADPTLINVQASIPDGAGSKVFARLMGAP